MSEQITPNPSVPTQVVAEVTFPKFINNLGIIPTSYKDSMSYYECLAWLCKYLEETVIPTVNQNGNAVQELQNLYNELQEYVINYFDNLDVQEEINNKLDDLVEDGTLTSLISNYINPFIITQNNKISQLEDKVDSATSGSPAGIYDTVSDLESADPNHSKIYLVLADGKWYYYDSTESDWAPGGIYQATQLKYDTTLTINNGVPNSQTVGKKINDNVFTENLLDVENCIDNSRISSDGTLISNSGFFVTNIFHVNSGDTIISQYWDEGISTVKNIYSIVKVQADGTFISETSASNHPYWLADEECFVRLNYEKFSASSVLINHMITLNTPTNKFKLFGYSLKENNEEIDQISSYRNVFDINDYSYGTSINSNGNLANATHYFTTNLMKCSVGDIFYSKYHDNNVTNVTIVNVFKYDENMQIIGRSSVNNKNYTATYNGYLKFTLINPNDSILDNKFTISKNEQLGEYVPHIRYIKENKVDSIIKIDKIDSTNYDITFGKFKVTLFKTVNVDTNSDNWNLKNIRDINNNIIVPQGTDIIGPVRINNNSDYIGGVHGDETTNYITVAINGISYDIADLTSMSGDTMNITMKSTIYDQDEGDSAFDRFINITFSDNKIHISNSFKATKNLTLKRATNGGLIAVQNNKIKDMLFNNAYYSTPPTTTQDIGSVSNTTATINTIYGSITVNNIKGYLNDDYLGHLTVFTNENPMRCKIYFDTYKEGTYSLSSGDMITGEFEYLLS